MMESHFFLPITVIFGACMDTNLIAFWSIFENTCENWILSRDTYPKSSISIWKSISSCMRTCTDMISESHSESCTLVRKSDTLVISRYCIEKILVMISEVVMSWSTRSLSSFFISPSFFVSPRSSIILSAWNIALPRGDRTS